MPTSMTPCPAIYADVEPIIGFAPQCIAQLNWRREEARNDSAHRCLRRLVRSCGSQPIGLRQFLSGISKGGDGAAASTMHQLSHPWGLANVWLCGGSPRDACKTRNGWWRNRCDALRNVPSGDERGGSARTTGRKRMAAAVSENANGVGWS